MRTSTLLVSALLLALAALARGDSLYISPFGDDSGSNNCKDNQNPCLTMTAAHTSANDGDTIYVGQGVYTGVSNFVKITKSLSIVAADDTTHPRNYVFNGQQQTNTNGFSVVGNITVKFVGLGFTNWNQYCSYVDCVQGTLDISDPNAALHVQSCEFWNNNNGITAREGQFYIQDSVFTGHSNAAILLSTQASSVNYVTISNVTMSLGGTGVLISKSNVHLRATTLTVNNMTTAINCDYSYNSGFNVNIGSSSFNYNSNTALIFSGVTGTATAGYLTISDTQLRGNGVTSNNGGGIYIGANVALAMRNSNIVGNTAVARGAGIYCDDQATANLLSVDISANTAPDGAAGWCSRQCAFVATSSTSFNNNEKQNTGPCSGL